MPLNPNNNQVYYVLNYTNLCIELDVNIEVEAQHPLINPGLSSVDLWSYTIFRCASIITPGVDRIINGNEVSFVYADSLIQCSGNTVSLDDNIIAEPSFFNAS